MSIRYFVSFTFSTPQGRKFGDIDITYATPIAGRDDLTRVAEFINPKVGYAVTITAFSRYDAAPTPPTANPRRDDHPSRPHRNGGTR